VEEALRNGKEVERRWTKGVVDVVVERKRRQRRKRNGKNSLVVVRQIGKGLRLEAPRCCRCACEQRRWRRALGASAEERGAGRGEEHVGGDDGRERKSDREECVREGEVGKKKSSKKQAKKSNTTVCSLLAACWRLEGSVDLTSDEVGQWPASQKEMAISE
jgi:hypothetical protein